MSSKLSSPSTSTHVPKREIPELRDGIVMYTRDAPPYVSFWFCSLWAKQEASAIWKFDISSFMRPFNSAAFPLWTRGCTIESTHCILYNVESQDALRIENTCTYMIRRIICLTGCYCLAYNMSIHQGVQQHAAAMSCLPLPPDHVARQFSRSVFLCFLPLVKVERMV